jgi:hypothetical protein
MGQAGELMLAGIAYGMHGPSGSSITKLAADSLFIANYTANMKDTILREYASQDAILRSAMQIEVGAYFDMVALGNGSLPITYTSQNLPATADPTGMTLIYTISNLVTGAWNNNPVDCVRTRSISFNYEVKIIAGIVNGAIIGRASDPLDWDDVIQRLWAGAKLRIWDHSQISELPESLTTRMDLFANSTSYRNSMVGATTLRANSYSGVESQNLSECIPR